MTAAALIHSQEIGGDPVAKAAAERMTIKEAAEFLGVSAATIYNLMQRGVLERHQSPVGVGRGGRRSYFLRKDVEALRRQMRGTAK